MPDHLADFVADMQSRNFSPETIRSYRWILRSFADFMQARSVLLENASRPDLKAYLDSLNAGKISHKTASLRFAALSSFYDYLVFEEVMDLNPVRPVMKRYLQAYKTPQGHTHQLITVEQAAALLHEMVDIRDKALLIVLLKTGVRRGELLSMEVDDIDWQNESITLKPKAKRSNRVVFFDDEAAGYLRRWLKVRSNRAKEEDRQLWLGGKGPLKRGGVDCALIGAASRLGLHNTVSSRMEDHFSAHCCRHWFTTMLDRSGMKRQHIQFLRGDVDGQAIGLYIHNDLEEIRKEYLRCIPKLGI